MEKKGGGWLAVILLAVCIIAGIVLGLFLGFSQKPDSLDQQLEKKEEPGSVSEDLDAVSETEETEKEIFIDAFSVSKKSTQGDLTTAEEQDGEADEEYLCSYISDRQITGDDLAELEGKSYKDLPSGSTVAQMVINELYAKYGYEFQNKEIQKYFEQKQWYQDITQRTSDMDAISKQMSGIEKSNIDFLRANDN